MSSLGSSTLDPKLVLREGEPHHRRCEVVLIPQDLDEENRHTSHLAFLQRQMGEEVEPLHLGVPLPDDCILILSMPEVNLLIQWYLKMMYGKDVMLPGTLEYVSEVKEINAKIERWRKEVEGAKK